MKRRVLNKRTYTSLFHLVPRLRFFLFLSLQSKFFDIEMISSCSPLDEGVSRHRRMKGGGGGEWVGSEELKRTWIRKDEPMRRSCLLRGRGRGRGRVRGCDCNCARGRACVGVEERVRSHCGGRRLRCRCRCCRPHRADAACERCSKFWSSYDRALRCRRHRGSTALPSSSSSAATSSTPHSAAAVVVVVEKLSPGRR